MKDELKERYLVIRKQIEENEALLKKLKENLEEYRQIVEKML